MPKGRPSVVVLTYNSGLSTGEIFQSVVQLADDIPMVDSFSRTGLRKLRLVFGGHLTQQVFEKIRR
jgi:hypothetical protein